MTTHYFPAASARGLSNINSSTQANKMIRETISGNTYKNYLMFFGKVDIDFILNHMYNKYPNFDIETYIKNIVLGYINFVKSLNISNVYLCELPLGHLSDNDLLNTLNSEFNHNCIASHMNEKYEKLAIYNTVLPLETRNKYLQLFNTFLKTLCETNKFTFLEINKYFNGSIPLKYQNTDSSNHHLDDSIHELYLLGITSNHLEDLSST
jgi:hypothetical protein